MKDNLTYSRFLHIHDPFILSEEIIKNFQGFILGSVFCSLSRIDKLKFEEYLEIIRFLKHGASHNVYIQQPFYLFHNEELMFFQKIDYLISEGLLDGIVVNSIGMLKDINNRFNINLIYSRFGFGKRKTTNDYFISELINNGASTVELYHYDTTLINDFKASKKDLQLWIRKGKSSINSFSRQCLVKKYEGNCTKSPESCMSGEFKLKQPNKEIELNISGHIINMETEFVGKNHNIDFYTIVENACQYEI